MKRRNNSRTYHTLNWNWRSRRWTNVWNKCKEELKEEDSTKVGTEELKGTCGFGFLNLCGFQMQKGSSRFCRDELPHGFACLLFNLFLFLFFSSIANRFYLIGREIYLVINTQQIGRREIFSIDENFSPKLTPFL